MYRNICAGLKSVIMKDYASVVIKATKLCWGSQTKKNKPKKGSGMGKFRGKVFPSPSKRYKHIL